MQALVLKNPNEFSIENVPVPEIKDGEALLRVKSCAICGTDIRILEGKKTRGVRYPSIIGHEIAGIIEETRGDVGNFKKGDRVSIAPVVPCHSCRYCLQGRENICQNRAAIGYEFDGGFAEFLRIPAEIIKNGQVTALPESMTFEEGSLVEPLSCCLNGIRKVGFGLGDTCLIIGAGPIGLMHVQLAKAAGATVIIVSEPNPARRDYALRFGTDHVVDPTHDDLRELVKKTTGGLGLDSIILAIGIPTVINDSLRLLRKGGTINLFAGFPDTGSCTLEANLIHYNEITINGTSASTRLDYHLAKDLVAQGKVNVKGLVTHRFGLESFREAYELSKLGKGLKTVIVPSL